MNRRLTRSETALAIGALVVALAGGTYMSTADVSAQGPGVGGPGRGGMGRGGPGGPGGPGRRGPDGMFGGLMLGRLELSDAQKEQAKQIVDSHKDEQQAFGEKLRAAHDALDAAITADRFDENLVRAKASDVALLDADAVVMRARIRNEVFQILTAEQKAEVKTNQEAMQKRRAEMETRMQERQGQHQRH